MDFRLPDLGEGIDSATVTNVMVKPGDTVAAGQNLIAVETDKASMEIPCDTAGTIDQVKVKPGDKIPTGAVLLTLSAATATTAAARPERESLAATRSPRSGARNEPHYFRNFSNAA